MLGRFSNNLSIFFWLWFLPRFSLNGIFLFSIDNDFSRSGYLWRFFYLVYAVVLMFDQSISDDDHIVMSILSV